MMRSATWLTAASHMLKSCSPQRSMSWCASGVICSCVNPVRCQTKPKNNTLFNTTSAGTPASTPSVMAATNLLQASVTNAGSVGETPTPSGSSPRKHRHPERETARLASAPSRPVRAGNALRLLGLFRSARIRQTSRWLCCVVYRTGLSVLTARDSITWQQVMYYSIECEQP